MLHIIELAGRKDEKRLREIFLSTDMDLAGDIEDHIIIRNNGMVCGGGLVYQMNANLYHLLTIAVRRDGRRQGTGGLLLQYILGRPWACCRDTVGDERTAYRVTTVSRGSSRAFYSKNGMVDCGFDTLVPPFDHQCLTCPDVDECQSAALEYNGTRPLRAMPEKSEILHVV
jgi:N-acetylglutamate synthase-like GNAT family acetyltransferase